MELLSSLQCSQEPNTTLVQLSSPHYHTLLTSCTHLIHLIFSTIKLFGEVHVKFTLEQATKALRGSRCIAPPLPPSKTQYPLYGRLGWPQGQSGQVRKVLPPSGFNSQTVQRIARCFTDSAILAHNAW